MYSIPHNPNRRLQGDRGVAIALAWFVNHDYQVSVPFSEGQRYDLIVDSPTNGLERVQVKTATFQRRGIYEATIDTSGGNQSWSGEPRYFNPSEVELVFVVTANATMYLIPSKEIVAKRRLVLGRKYAPFILQHPSLA